MTHNLLNLSQTEFEKCAIATYWSHQYSGCRKYTVRATGSVSLSIETIDKIQVEPLVGKKLSYLVNSMQVHA